MADYVAKEFNSSQIPTALTFTPDTVGNKVRKVSAVSAAGALDLRYDAFEITTGAGAMALTLADGKEGQLITIKMVVDGGGTATLTPANFHDGTTLAFADATDTADLYFDGTDWKLLANVGATVA